METVASAPGHEFHVPVMGIGFTIDTPIRLAPLGIESSISLVNDDVIEAARKYHSQARLLPYVAIGRSEQDSRARRIRAYLDLVHQLVEVDTKRLRESSFTDPRGIRRYFELLADDSPTKQRYLQAQALAPGAERDAALEALRPLVQKGPVGVNIMTKLDGVSNATGESTFEHDSDAHAALRGFAESDLPGLLIFSAGANPGLFAYLSEFPSFFPEAGALPKKKIVLKVSDFRSAHVQGKMLARRGLWVSEYRLESGLNCGGHAFPTDGLLMGPILETFCERRADLEEGLFAAYSKGIQGRGEAVPDVRPPVRITAQGGVGTAEEARLLRERFGVDSTGWGSPFLMVPEAVALDERTKNNLVEAKEGEVKLTWSSPLGVRFWWLETCASEESRQQRIEQGYPGSVCSARHIALNSDYKGVPLCKGSRAYQKRKLAELDPKHRDYDLQVERIQAPACICVDLTGSFLECAAPDEERPPPAICPGPNVINFQGTFELEEMVDHIYGRRNIITRPDRPHVFIREVELYLEVFDEDFDTLDTAVQSRSRAQLEKTLEGLDSALAFYRKLLPELSQAEQPEFGKRLRELSQEVSVRRDQLAGQEDSVALSH